jgi:hypothetical protein
VRRAGAEVSAFFDPPVWRVDDFADADGHPPHVDPNAPDTALAGFSLRPAVADQLREWWSERGFAAHALDALIADPVSVASFRDRLTQSIRRGRVLRYAAT